MTELSPSDLEQLFIDKLQLKYKLTERDLKKAFSRFDKDGNGQLDTKEIGVAVGLMLNGVSDEQIRGLVRRFDINGDGKVSYEEFLKYLLKRSNARATDVNAASSSRLPRKVEDSRLQSANTEGSRSGRASDIPANHRRVGAISSGKEEQSKHSNLTADFTQRRERSENKPQNRVDDRRIDYYNDHASAADIDYDDDESEGEELDDFKYLNNETDQGSIRSQMNQSRGYPSYDQRPSSAASVAQSDAGSHFDPTNATQLEYRCKVFLENLRSYLNRKVISLRDENRLPHHLTMSSKELLEKTGCLLLNKAFQSESSKSRTRKENQLVEYHDFIR